MNKYMIAVSFLALFSFITAIYLGKYYYVLKNKIVLFFKKLIIYTR